MRSSGIGFDPDGFSSSLDQLKAVRALCFGEEPSEAPTGDPDEFWVQKSQKMWQPPLHVVQAYD